MSKKYLLLLGFSFGLFIEASAQTLFTVAGDAVSKEEFLSQYKKNNTKDLSYKADAIKDYLDIYAVYKMKIKEAHQLQIDTISDIKNEINNYKYQLSKNYQLDKETLDKMAKQEYDRMKTERNVAHILLQVYSGQSPEAAKAKIDSIYNVIKSGKATFEAMAAQYSMDKSTGTKGGSLGYINAFQTPYDFENVAYTTAVGNISEPFKTPFGYHILKVIAERPSSGQVEVAQILLAANTPEEVAEKMKLAATLKAKLSSGAETFENLVRQYSEDSYSVGNEGKLAPFGTGKMEPSIEDVVFALNKPGQISEPVQSVYGVHIFKLIKKIPLGSFDTEKKGIISKIEGGSIMDAVKAQNSLKLKASLDFKEYPDNLQSFINAINQSELENGNQLGSYPQLTAVLFELGKKKYTQQDFLQYINTLTQGRLNGKKEETFRNLYRIYIDKTLTDIQMNNLEKNNKEYRDLVKEYENGSLLFYLMNEKIWSKATTNDTALTNYFVTHQDKYMWQPGFEGVIFQSKNGKALRQIEAALASGKNIEEAMKMVNTPETAEKIIQQTGKFENSYVSMYDATELKAMQPTVIKKDGENGEIMIYPTQIYSAIHPKTLEDAKGLVIDDYQKTLEQEWETTLKKKYPLKINDAVLNSIIK